MTCAISRARRLRAPLERLSYDAEGKSNRGRRVKSDAFPFEGGGGRFDFGRKTLGALRVGTFPPARLLRFPSLPPVLGGFGHLALMRRPDGVGGGRIQAMRGTERSRRTFASVAMARTR